MRPLPARHRAGRIVDPVMLCMIGAVILAVGTSIALRVVVGGPAAVQASNSYLPSAHRPASASAPLAPAAAPEDFSSSEPPAPSSR